MAGARAHNRWLAELCSDSPERRCGVATVPVLHDIAEAVAEIERLAAEGFRALMIPTLWGGRPGLQRRLLRAGLVRLCGARDRRPRPLRWGVARHVAPDGLVAIYATEAWWWAARPLWVLLWSGAFDRHPDLKFALTEDGAWWLPGVVQRMDEKWIGGHNTAKLGDAFTKHVGRLPSEYLGTSIFVGASTPSREEIERRHQIGVGAFLWGNDFPHPEGTWPHTRQSLRDTFFDVPEDEVRRMLGTNAAALYRFDTDKLAGLAERIGPSMDELRTPAGAVAPA